MNAVKVFTVDDDDRGWRVTNQNGRVLRRASTRQDAISLGAAVARRQSEGDPRGHFAAQDARLEVFNRDGFYSFERNYSRKI